MEELGEIHSVKINDRLYHTGEILRNQKIFKTLIAEWQYWTQKITMLKFELSSKDFNITQDEFNRRATHYLDKKEVLELVYFKSTGHNLKDNR